MEELGKELEEQRRDEHWKILEKNPDHLLVALQLPVEVLDRAEAMVESMKNDLRPGALRHVLTITPSVVVRVAIIPGLELLEAEYAQQKQAKTE